MVPAPALPPISHILKAEDQLEPLSLLAETSTTISIPITKLIPSRSTLTSDLISLPSIRSLPHPVSSSPISGLTSTENEASMLPLTSPSKLGLPLNSKPLLINMNLLPKPVALPINKSLVVKMVPAEQGVEVVSSDKKISNVLTEKTGEQTESPSPKRKRGRPRKYPPKVVDPNQPKKGRGRPRLPPLKEGEVRQKHKYTKKLKFKVISTAIPDSNTANPSS